MKKKIPFYNLVQVVNRPKHVNMSKILSWYRELEKELPADSLLLNNHADFVESFEKDLERLKDDKIN